ncbi:MAG: GNAT family N-acetyltransferase [Promethearchaeota archaeon Loki_b32]|nr:MAG: GNAT family N-acetyltransferase [Candidatus Lokiarchaeota archaeon Loki_b32]
MMARSISFRKANISDLSGIVKVNVDTWKTTYQGIISEEFLQNLSYEDKEANWRQRLEKPTQGAIIYVAEKDSKEIVGFTLATLEKCNPIIALLQVERYNGELCAIYVLEEFQHKKVGTELVQLVVNHFKLNNIHSMITWVLKENPSRRFYEKLGGKFLGEQSIEIGGIKYIEIAYGWENTEAILSKY